MASTGIKQESMKLQNRCAILTLLNDCGRMSRKDISAQIGLTPAAVTQLANEMIEEGIVEELGQAQETKVRAGRKKVLLGINYDSRRILAASVEVNQTTISLCNLHGDVLRQTFFATDSAAPPEAFLGRIAGEAKALAQDCPPDQLLGMGVTVTGRVNRAEGVSLSSYSIWQRPVSVRALIQRELPCPVVLENNVKAFAEAELVYGLGRDAGNLLFFKWGPGVGSAIAVNQEVYQGRDRIGSELGHYIAVPGGELCSCGRHGCLTMLITVSAICRSIGKILSRENTPLLYGELGGIPGRFTEAWFCDWLENKTAGLSDALDTPVRDILTGCFKHAATALVNTITVLAPDRVVLFGSMLENPAMAQALTELCADCNAGAYPDGYMTLSRLCGAFRHVGPAALIARERFFGAAGLPLP